MDGATALTKLHTSEAAAAIDRARYTRRQGAAEKQQIAQALTHRASGRVATCLKDGSALTVMLMAVTLCTPGIFLMSASVCSGTGASTAMQLIAVPPWRSEMRHECVTGPHQSRDSTEHAEKLLELRQQKRVSRTGRTRPSAKFLMLTSL